MKEKPQTDQRNTEQSDISLETKNTKYQEMLDDKKYLDE